MNLNEKYFKYAAISVGCLTAAAIVFVGGRYIYNKINDPMDGQPVTMMSHAEKDVETHVPVSDPDKQEIYVPITESASIALPSIDPTEDEKTTEATEAPTDAPVTYPLDRSVPYEDAIKVSGFAAAELTGYQAMYPGLYAAKSEAIETEEKTVYLTFDDGPTSNTLNVLDELDKYGVKATFFVYPGSKNLDSVKELLLEIANRGHNIAIHSWTHKYDAIYQSVDAFLADMDKVARLIYETTGLRPCVYRFPGGSNNGRAKKVAGAILDEMERRGFVCFDWNSSTQDAENKPFTASQLADNALSTFGTRKRVIVLAHDGAGQKNTPYAIGKIVSTAHQNGYKFGVLDNSCSELLFYKR